MILFLIIEALLQQRCGGRATQRDQSAAGGRADRKIKNKAHSKQTTVAISAQGKLLLYKAFFQGSMNL